MQDAIFTDQNFSNMPIIIENQHNNIERILEIPVSRLSFDNRLVSIKTTDNVHIGKLRYGIINTPDVETLVQYQSDEMSVKDLDWGAIYQANKTEIDAIVNAYSENKPVKIGVFSKGVLKVEDIRGNLYDFYIKYDSEIGKWKGTYQLIKSITTFQ